MTTTSAKPWARSEQLGQCPVPPKDQQWVERWMRWCVKEFGPEVVKREIALPVSDFFPPGFVGAPDQVGEMVGRVCTVMGVDPDAVGVQYFESPEEESRALRSNRGRHRTVGRYRKVDGHAVIELDLREAENPAVLAAIVAHELGHVRLLGEDRIQGIEVDHERLTDLVTVFLGMGVFTANAAYRFTKSVQGFSVLPLGDLTERMLTGTALDPTHHLGYLTERQFGYALACYCLLRGETDPLWSRHLEPGARAALKQGLQYFADRPPATQHR
ncbi:hypothetical protein ACFVYE_41760 [Streptomyces sp. NPDC058239]|uniref:hypothetical protein n=1 Tax=Streptomyces sp. NPDC058239 TaxID=3346395 RepID=UPI0036E292FF